MMSRVQEHTAGQGHGEEAEPALSAASGGPPRGRKGQSMGDGTRYNYRAARPLQRGQEHPPPCLSPPKPFRNRCWDGETDAPGS